MPLETETRNVETETTAFKTETIKYWSRDFNIPAYNSTTQYLEQTYSFRETMSPV